jgi:predicted transcriptional regulator
MEQEIQEYCARETHLVYKGNNNIASMEQIESTRGTRIFRLTNTSHILTEEEYCSQETHLFYSGNINIVFEEQISSTRMGWEGGDIVSDKKISYEKS